MFYVFLRQNNQIYLISSKLISDTISICLNDSTAQEVKQEKINPYVLRCLLPDSVFQFSHNISLSVCDKGTVLVKQLIHVSQMILEPTHIPSTEKNHQTIMKKESFTNDKSEYFTRVSDNAPEENSLQTLTGISGYHHTIKENPNDLALLNNYDDHSLRQYVLDKLSILLNNETSGTVDESDYLNLGGNSEEIGQEVSLRGGSFSKLPEMDPSNRMNSYLLEKTDIRLLRYSSRSLSLPPTLMPVLRDTDPHYMDMGGSENHGIKPHEQLLIDMRNLYMENMLTGNTESEESQSQMSCDRYASMTLGERVPKDLRNLLKKGLSTSQQELLDLMQDFKEGESSISNVEQQFQLWTEKHSSVIKQDQGEPKVRKTSVFALPWRKHPRKRVTKNPNPNKDYPKTSIEKSEDQEPSRKISDISASSNSTYTSSKTSDSSSKVISPREEMNYNDNSFAVGYNGWVSTNPSTPFCPLYPKDNPPPLPNRPPPLYPIVCPFKPTPVPRRNLPDLWTKEGKICPNRYDKMVGVQKKGFKDIPYYVNYSVISVSKKNGLNDMVESTTSETTITESSNYKEIFPNNDQDFGEYEYPSMQTDEEEKPQIRIFRRSASLPSNLNSGEFSIVLENDHSVLDESFVESNVQDDQNAFNCEQCSSMVESLKSNVYMSLLEFQGNCPRRQQPRGALSESQQELLELMYAFKRGEKTLSQVEQQFKEWHSKHMGVIFPSAISTQKQEKHPKQSVFKGNLGLKKILGIPKKKTSIVDIRSPDIEQDILRRTKKASESSSSSPKRLSKMSLTSTTSSASEINDTGKANKIYGKKSEAGSSGLSVGPPFPKRPPPMPPVKKTTHEPKPEIPLEGPIKSPKPIPPPKPKSLFRQKTCDFDDLPDSVIPVGNSTLPENTRADNNADDMDRPPSPIYIDPNPRQPKTTRAGAKKPSDAKITKIPIKGTEPNKTRNPAIRAPQGSTSKPVKPPPNLPPHTKELLKMANLLKFDVEVMSKFYIRRSKSFPNLRMSQMQNIPVYIQLIDSVVEPKSTQTNQNTNVRRFDNMLYFHEYKDDTLYTEQFLKSSCK